MKLKPIIIAYDISNHKKRYRARKILKEWSVDNQKSVYECRVSISQAEELFLQLTDIIDNKKDKILMAWIEPHRKLLYRGRGRDIITKKFRCFR